MGRERKHVRWAITSLDGARSGVTAADRVHSAAFRGSRQLRPWAVGRTKAACSAAGLPFNSGSGALLRRALRRSIMANKKTRMFDLPGKHPLWENNVFSRLTVSGNSQTTSLQVQRTKKKLFDVDPPLKLAEIRISSALARDPRCSIGLRGHVDVSGARDFIYALRGDRRRCGPFSGTQGQLDPLTPWEQSRRRQDGSYKSRPAPNKVSQVSDTGRPEQPRRMDPVPEPLCSDGNANVTS